MSKEKFVKHFKNSVIVLLFLASATIFSFGCES